MLLLFRMGGRGGGGGRYLYATSCDCSMALITSKCAFGSDVDQVYLNIALHPPTYLIIGNCRSIYINTNTLKKAFLRCSSMPNSEYELGKCRQNKKCVYSCLSVLER